MKRFAHGLARVPILVFVLAARGLAQLPPAPTPTLGPTGACPAVASFQYDVSSIAGADSVQWQLRRGAPGQGFGAATPVDSGVELGTSGSVQRDLRAFDPVLVGERYFFRVRARQGNTNLTQFSSRLVFAPPSVSPDGMFTASPGANAGTLRLDWNLTGPIADCSDHIVSQIVKAGAAPFVAAEVGPSGTSTYDLNALGPGDYDVSLRAGFEGGGPEDAVGRESAPVRVTVAAPVLSIDDLSSPEGIAPTTLNAIVRLSPTTSQEVTVLVGARPVVGSPVGRATEGDCAAGRDFTFAFRSVRIPAGQPEAQVPFTLCGDAALESDETFQLGLTSAVNAVLGDSIGQGTILNDDDPTPPPPALPLNVSLRDAPFTEGNSNNTQVVAVRLSDTATDPVTVLIGARPGGTATEGSCRAGRDFTFALRTVTIDPGNKEVDVPFTLCGDTAFENDETFSLGLTSAVNAALGDSVGNMTIRNDDEAPAEGPIAPRPELPNLQVIVDNSAPFRTQEAPRLLFVVEVVNTGAGAASNVVVQSTLPLEVAFVRVEENQFDGCTGGVITDAAGAALVRCSASSLPAGASRSVRIVGEIAGSVADGTRVVFGANADPFKAVTEVNEADNFAFLSTIVRASDLLLGGAPEPFTKTPLPTRLCLPDPFGVLPCAKLIEGTVVELQVRVRNQGSVSAPATTIRVDWPGGIASVDSQCTAGTLLDVSTGQCSGESFSPRCFDSCAVPAIPAGESIFVILTGLMQPPRGRGTVRVTATLDPDDQVITNNSKTFDLAVP
jgi:hypothetical protein